MAVIDPALVAGACVYFVVQRLSKYGSVTSAWLSGLEIALPVRESAGKPPEVVRRRKAVKSKEKDIELRKETIAGSDLELTQCYSELNVLIICVLIVTAGLLSNELLCCLAPKARCTVVVPLYFIYLGVAIALLVLARLLSLCGLTSIEFRLSVLAGFLMFWLAVGALFALSPGFLDFGLDHAVADAALTVQQLFDRFGINLKVQLSAGHFKLGAAFVSGIVGSLLVFPGFRLARTHLKVLQDETAVGVRALHYTSFFAPALTSLLWLVPIHEALVVQSDTLTEVSFRRIRLLCIFISAALRIVCARRHVQAFMDSGSELAQRSLGQRHTSYDAVRIQVASLYRYTCIAALQLVGPAILILFTAYGIKKPGNVCWGICEHVFGGSSCAVGGPEASALLQFNSAFYEAVFSYAAWWIMTSWFACSIVGIMYVRAQQAADR